MSPNQHPESAGKSLIRGSVILVVAVSMWVGILISGMSKPWAMIVSLVGGLLSMLVGMVFASVKHDGDMKKFFADYEENKKQMMEYCQKAVEDVARKERKTYGGMAVYMSKVVSDRVASRLIARHAQLLSVEEHREAIFKEADDIVKEEIIAFRDALSDATKKA